MPRALHDVSFQRPFPKWPPGVRARILQRQDFSIHVAECHIALSFDFKRPARPGFNLADMCHVNIVHHDHLDSVEPERTSVLCLSQVMDSGVLRRGRSRCYIHAQNPPGFMRSSRGAC